MDALNDVNNLLQKNLEPFQPKLTKVPLGLARIFFDIFFKNGTMDMNIFC